MFPSNFTQSARTPRPPLGITPACYSESDATVWPLIHNIVTQGTVLISC